jgi:hypothetical protein
MSTLISKEYQGFEQIKHTDEVSKLNNFHACAFKQFES